MPDSELGSGFVSGSAPAVTTGWGWSQWSEWGGSCPQVCPGRCRRRGRFCNGVCKTGKVGRFMKNKDIFSNSVLQGTLLSDCPELEEAGNGTTGATTEDPFS